MDFFKSLYTWVFSILFILLMFPFTLIIWLISAPFGKGKHFVHKWLCLQGRVLIKASPLWYLEITGKENYKPGEHYIMISNHQSLLDIPVVNCLGFDYKWVSKIENFRVPVLGQSMYLAGYIPIKRGNKESVIKMMEESEKALNNNESLFIFPEGTRSPDNSIRKYKAGAFRLAVGTSTSILPVLIDGTGAVFPKKGIVFSSGHRLRMRVLAPVLPEDFGTDNPEELAKKMQAVMSAQLEILRRDG